MFGNKHHRHDEYRQWDRRVGPRSDSLGLFGFIMLLGLIVVVFKALASIWLAIIIWFVVLPVGLLILLAILNHHNRKEMRKNDRLQDHR